MITQELKSKEEMFCAYDVLKHMYDSLSESQYEEIIAKRAEENYRMVGVFDNDKCVCAAGFWIGTRFYSGKFIQLDNLVTLPDYRSKGVGKMIVDYVKKIGKNEDCSRLLVDSYVENFDAHKFFFREGFIIRGYHLNYQL